MLHLGSTAIHHLDDHGPSGDEDELLGLRDVLHIKASCRESSLIYSCHVRDNSAPCSQSNTEWLLLHLAGAVFRLRLLDFLQRIFYTIAIIFWLSVTWTPESPCGRYSVGWETWWAGRLGTRLGTRWGLLKSELELKISDCKKLSWKLSHPALRPVQSRHRGADGEFCVGGLEKVRVARIERVVNQSHLGGQLLIHRPHPPTDLFVGVETRAVAGARTSSIKTRRPWI